MWPLVLLLEGHADVDIWAVDMQMDPKDAMIAALQREVHLLRSENSYLRDQVHTPPPPPRQLTTARSVARVNLCGTKSISLHDTCALEPLVHLQC